MPRRVAHARVQPLDVPLLGVGFGRQVAGDEVGDGVAPELRHDGREVLGLHELLPVLEDRLPLVVDHVVVLEKIFLISKFLASTRFCAVGDGAGSARVG
jgi:hypothetical protein